ATHINVQPYGLYEFKIETNSCHDRKNKHRLARLDGFSEEARHEIDCRTRPSRPLVTKGKGQSDFSDWPLLMPATTYAPTHLARAVPSALRGLTSVFGMGTGGSPAVRSPTTRSSRWSLALGRWPKPSLQTFKDRPDKTED